MIQLNEISEILRKKGASYFSSNELELFIQEIHKKFESPIEIYSSLLQVGESMQLDLSFINKKTLIDFTLKQNSIECVVFFLKDITTIQEEVTSRYRTLTIFNNGTLKVMYKAYGEKEMHQLGIYSQRIANTINKELL